MNQKERLKQLLSDGKPHSNWELNQICFAYTQRLNEMKKAGEINFKNWNDPHCSSKWFWQIEPKNYVQTSFIEERA